MLFISCALILISVIQIISAGIIKDIGKKSTIITDDQLKQMCESIRNDLHSGVDPLQGEQNVFNIFSQNQDLKSFVNGPDNSLERSQDDLSLIKLNGLVKVFSRAIENAEKLDGRSIVKLQNNDAHNDDDPKDDDDHDDHDIDDDADDNNETSDEDYDTCEYIDYPDEIDLDEIDYDDLVGVDYEYYEYEDEPFGLSFNLKL